MKIVEKINENQLVVFENLYYEYFKTINVDGFSDKVLRNFARRKIKDYKKNIADSIYMFAIERNDLLGFIHGKYSTDSGKVCHVYGNNQNITLKLLWELANFYKQKGITDLELYYDNDEIKEVQFIELEKDNERINRSK